MKRLCSKREPIGLSNLPLDLTTGSFSGPFCGRLGCLYPRPISKSCRDIKVLFPQHAATSGKDSMKNNRLYLPLLDYQRKRSLVENPGSSLCHLRTLHPSVRSIFRELFPFRDLITLSFLGGAWTLSKDGETRF